MAQPQTADPVTDVLKAAPASNAMRAAAWDAYEQAANEDDLAAKLKPLALPTHIKAQLWDLKVRATDERTPDFHLDVKASDTFSPTEMLGGLWENLNPLPMIRHLGRLEHQRFVEAQEAASRGDYTKAARMALLPPPISTGADIVKGLGKAQWDQVVKAYQSFQQGRVSEGVGYTLAAILPVIGPMEADAAETMARPGQFSRGVGKALAPFVPAVAKTVLPTRVRTPSLGQGNVAEAEAVAFGQQHGIPVDAATASSNRFVKATQQLSDRTPIGSLVAERAAEQQAGALQRVGGDLAARAHRAPVTSEQAGQAVRDAVTGQVKGFHAEATTQYERLRAIEANPQRAPSMYIDLTQSRDALRPIYLRLKREAELVPLQGDKARALTALDRLLNGYDVKVPLSIVDEALGDVKALARGADIPELRTQGQGVAAQAVQVLDRQVQTTARQAGVDAFRALQEGRKATVQKYLAADVLDDLIRGTGDEPVRITKRLTATQDTAVAKLREVQQFAPQELPKIGRAFLETLFEKAQQKGGFGRTDRLFSDWHNLGPETKRLLFKDPGLVKDLDRFFLLAERMNVSTNPSGTALTAASWSTGVGLIFYSPGVGVPLVITTGVLSKLMHSPRAVKAFTRGLSMPVANQAGAAAVTSEILKVAGDAVVPLSRAAEDQADQPPAIGQR